MNVAVREPGSFRDPSGAVFSHEGRIFRTISEGAAPAFDAVRTTGLLDRLESQERAVGTRFIESPPEIGDGDIRYVVEHPRLPFVSYPYEWTFSALKAAALHHLDVQLEAMDKDVTLSDASAYNVQFVGPRPVFIDVLSFRPYRDGEFWAGHKQFCEQFLNPLLVRALLGVPHNDWYRGSLEGISSEYLSRALSLRHKLSWNVLTQVVLQAALQRSVGGRLDREQAEAINRRRFPRSSFVAMLQRLRRYIEGLQPADRAPTQWQDYADDNTYSHDDLSTKKQFVGDAVTAADPAMVWDLGCNVGEFAEVALDAGADHVVGWDVDHGALEAGFKRAEERRHNFLPLHFDAANPSPSQGWGQAERYGMAERGPADTVLALAFVHHLAIARNVPLDHVATWLTKVGRTGVVEFVEKGDSTVRQMLAVRKDIFPDYTLDAFLSAMSKHARITRRLALSAPGSESMRHLIAFERHEP